MKHVLLYNSATSGLTKQDATSLDLFHRQQLRRIIEKSYPNKISDKALYEQCHEEPLPSTITRSRWQLFGHILRLVEATPTSKVMEFYCETSELEGFRGSPKETLVTTLLKDIKRVIEVDSTFPLQPVNQLGQQQICNMLVS